MEYKVVKSDVPVIWLDTHAITSIAYEIHRKETGEQYDRRIVDAYNDIVKLRNAHKIICFESDQLLELAVRPKLIKGSTRIMSQLSGGIKIHNWEVKPKQIRLGIDACAKKSKTAKILWSDIYEGSDPFKDKSGGLGVIIRVDLAVDLRVEQWRLTNKAILKEWRRVKEDLPKKYSTYKSRFNYQLALEKGIDGKLAEDGLRYMKIDPTELLVHKPYLLDMLDMPTRQWQSLDPNCKDVYAAVADFFKSDYNIKLPVNDIAHILYAEKLAGSEKLKESDRADIDNIAAFLPYVNYMLLDKAMIDKVKKHGLDKKYQTKLFRLAGIADILAEIQS